MGPDDAANKVKDNDKSRTSTMLCFRENMFRLMSRQPKPIFTKEVGLASAGSGSVGLGEAWSGYLSANNSHTEHGHHCRELKWGYAEESWPVP